MLSKGEPVLLRNTENPLGVDGGRAILAPLPDEQCPDAAIGISGPTIDDRAQLGKKGYIIGLAIRSVRLGWFGGALVQVGPGDAQSAGNNAQYVSPSALLHGSKGEVRFLGARVPGPP